VKFAHRTQILVGVPCIVFGAVILLAKDHFCWWKRLAGTVEESYPQIFIAIGLSCVVWAISASSSDKNKKKWLLFAEHENESRDFYCESQARLKHHQGNESEVKQLSLELDAQLKLEDFLIRFREAEHAKIKVWGTIFVSGLVSLVVALLTILAKAKSHVGP
jgi:hypothetical protein